MKLWFGTMLLASMLIATACDDDDDNKVAPNDGLSLTDINFMKRAGRGQAAEIKFSELAVSKATDTRITAFAQKMIDEHTASLAELKDIAGDFDNVLIEESLDSTNQVNFNELGSMTGMSFDTTFMKMQVDHLGVLQSLFQTEADGGSKPNVKAYASTHLSDINANFEEADTLHATLIDEN